MEFTNTLKRWLDMRRTRIVQAILDRISGKTYLEIGVEFGTTFLRIKAPRRIAVDPKFKIPSFLKRLSQSGRAETRYFEMTSDEFFSTQGPILAQHPIDVAFVDGLHSYEQSSKDVENCLDYLSERGVVILHDCNPATWAVGLPAKSHAEARSSKALNWAGEWSGDVWKTIAQLRSTRSDLEVFVLDCDHGVGIVRKGEPERMSGLSIEDVQRLTYADLEADRSNLLGLKEYAYFQIFLKRLAPV